MNLPCKSGITVDRIVYRLNDKVGFTPSDVSTSPALETKITKEIVEVDKVFESLNEKLTDLEKLVILTCLKTDNIQSRS